MILPWFLMIIVLHWGILFVKTTFGRKVVEVTAFTKFDRQDVNWYHEYICGTETRGEREEFFVTKLMKRPFIHRRYLAVFRSFEAAYKALISRRVRKTGRWALYTVKALLNFLPPKFLNYLLRDYILNSAALIFGLFHHGNVSLAGDLLISTPSAKRNVGRIFRSVKSRVILILLLLTVVCRIYIREPKWWKIT